MNKVSLWAAGLAVVLAGSSGYADKGMAVLKETGTIPVKGTVLLEDTPGGLKIDAEFTKAPAGNHAFHIHEFGLCDDNGNAAGSHYNPGNHPHGNALKDGISKTHAGDFGSITVTTEGIGSLHVVVPGLALTKGDTPVAGRAFVLHEKPDAFTQPVGNAGGRIACGPIVITGK